MIGGFFGFFSPVVNTFGKPLSFAIGAIVILALTIFIISLYDRIKKAKINSHNRRENFRNHISKAATCLFWFIAACIISLIFTEIWHLITPSGWHYIDSAQKAKIETILFSGASAAMVSKFSKKYI